MAKQGLRPKAVSAVWRGIAQGEISDLAPGVWGQGSLLAQQKHQEAPLHGCGLLLDPSLALN